MATSTTTYTFSAGTDAVASEVNTNFTDLTSFINTNCIQKDGSLSMTQPLTLSGDPSSSLHAATKAYVDANTTMSVLSSVVRTTDSNVIGTTIGDLGITLPAFTMPDLTDAERAVEITLSWAATVIQDVAGNDNLFITLAKSDDTQLQSFAFRSLGLGSVAGVGGFLRFLILDNSVFAASSSVSGLKFRGIADAGFFHTDATATSPTIALAKLI